MNELQWSAGRVFERREVRGAGLRRGREVFEGEEPFQIIAHADHTAATSASGGPSLHSVRACCYDAARENKLHNIPLIIDRGQSANQTASAVYLAAWRAEARQAARRRFRAARK